MKKIIVLASALFMFNVTLNAQESVERQKPEGRAKEKPQQNMEHKKTPEERAQKHVEQLNIAAGLSEDQKMKVKDLALAKIQKMDAIRDKYKGQKENKDAAKQEMDAVRKDYRQSIKSLLTPEQLEKVKKRGYEMKQKRKENKEVKGSKNKKKEELNSKPEEKKDDKLDNPEDAIIDVQD